MMLLTTENLSLYNDLGSFCLDSNATAILDGLSVNEMYEMLGHVTATIDTFYRMVSAAPEDESEMLDHLRAVTTYGNAIWGGASTPFQHVSVSTVSRNAKTKRYEPVPVSAHTSQYDVKV